MANLAGTLLTGSAAVSLAALGFSAHDGFVSRIDYALSDQYAVKLDQEQLTPQSIDILTPDSFQEERYAVLVNADAMIDAEIVKRNLNDGFYQVYVPGADVEVLSFSQSYGEEAWRTSSFTGSYHHVNISLTTEIDVDRQRSSNTQAVKVSAKRFVPSQAGKSASGCGAQHGSV